MLVLVDAGGSGGWWRLSVICRSWHSVNAVFVSGYTPDVCNMINALRLIVSFIFARRNIVNGSMTCGIGGTIAEHRIWSAFIDRPMLTESFGAGN